MTSTKNESSSRESRQKQQATRKPHASAIQGHPLTRLPYNTINWFSLQPASASPPLEQLPSHFNGPLWPQKRREPRSGSLQLFRTTALVCASPTDFNAENPPLNTLSPRLNTHFPRIQSNNWNVSISGTHLKSKFFPHWGKEKMLTDRKDTRATAVASPLTSNFPR